VALTVILGLAFTLAATFVSMALFVRTSFGRVPHAITLLPVPLVLYNLWMSAWFVFECLRQFVLTAMTPGSALRMVAFVFLVAALCSVACLYGCVSVVHQFLGGQATRRVRRGARYLALAWSAMLIVGWSAYHFHADSGLFTTMRGWLGHAAFPLALGSWIWLLAGARRLTDTSWRASVEKLARAYVGLFSMMFVFSVVRGRMEAAAPPLPLVIDVFLVLAYTLVTVRWVESIQRAARSGSRHPAIP
jgi:hypothetical protein